MFNFFRHYKSPPFHSVIRIHLISFSYHILVILPSYFSSMEQMLMLLFHVEGATENIIVAALNKFTDRLIDLIE